MADKVLVTGATGFLGSYIARVLLQRGYPVRAIARASSDRSLLGEAAGSIEWIESDLLDPFGMEEAMQGIETVYHSAAIISFHKSEVPWMIQVNRDGTANVVNAALEAGVKNLLHVSSVAALGRTNAAMGSVVTEDAEWEAGGKNTDYGLSKHLAEREAWRGHAEGLNVTMINPGTIIGGGFWDRGTARFFARAEEGIKFYTDGLSGFVDVRDVAEKSVDLIEKECFGQRYTAVGQNLEYRRIFQVICKELGVPEPSVHAGPFLLGLAWRMEGLKARLTGGKPDLTRETARVLYSNYRYPNERILAAVGGTFRAVEDTLVESAAVYQAARENGRSFGILPLN